MIDGLEICMHAGFIATDDKSRAIATAAVPTRFYMKENRMCDAPLMFLSPNPVTNYCHAV